MKKNFLIAFFLLFVWNITFAQGYFTGDLADVYYIKHAASGKYLTAEPGNPLANGHFVIRDFTSITNLSSAKFTFTKKTFTEKNGDGDIIGDIIYYTLKSESGYNLLFTSAGGNIMYPTTANTNDYCHLKLTGTDPSFYLQIRARTDTYSESPAIVYIAPASGAEGAIVGAEYEDPEAWIIEFAAVAKPVLVSQSPAAGAVAIPADADITLTFNKNVTWESGASSLITITNNGTNATFAVTGTSADGKTLTISHAPLTYGTYTISVPDGSITDFSGNITWSFSALIDNIALHKPTNQSTYLIQGSVTYSGAKAVDGLTSGDNSRWISSADKGIQWLEIDLEDNYEIVSLKIYRGASGSANNKQFEVQAWINGNWAPFLSETNYTTNLYEKDLTDPVVTNKVRYYVPDYTNNRPRVFEIQLFGFPATRTGLNDKAAQAVSVYSKDNVLFAVSNSSNLIRQISLYNTQGQLIYTNDKVNAPAYTINQQIVVPGVYIVKLVTEQGVKNVKVLIK